jgi:hypothetical protein
MSLCQLVDALVGLVVYKSINTMVLVGFHKGLKKNMTQQTKI